jgi:hypothetical protein
MKTDYNDVCVIISDNQRHQRQLAAIRLNRFLGNVGIPLRVPEDPEAGPSTSGNNVPQPGPCNSPNNNNNNNNDNINSPVALRMSPPPVRLAQSPTSTSENAPHEQPSACMTNNMPSPRMPIGRLTLRHRRMHFPESMSFESRMQRVKDRLHQRQHQLMREIPFRTSANNEHYQGPRSVTSPVLSPSLASLRSMMRCSNNNPDWFKLSGQSMSNRIGRGMYLPSNGGEASTSYPETWRIETPPQENATNLSVPPPLINPEPPANENTENQQNETSEAPEEHKEPVAGPSTEGKVAGEENEAGPNAKRARTEEDGQVSQSMQSLSDIALNSSILSMLECPVCLDHMGPPIHQCRRGHLVCNNCRGQLIQCPTCRSRFTDLRNLALERIADLLHFPCKNDECGQSFKLRSKDEHELNCPWRVYKCMAHDCQWQGLHQSLLTHVQEQHSELILVGNSHSLDMPLDIAFTRNYVFYAWGELFRANMQRGHGNNTVHSLAQYLGPVAQASQFRFSFKLEGVDSKGVVRNMVYERTMHSDNVRLSQAYAAGDCFCISVEQAKHFLSDRKVTMIVTLDKVPA